MKATARFPVTAMLLLLGAASCSEQATEPDAERALLAKGKPAPPPVSAYLEWDDGLTVVIGTTTVPAGIQGDGRLADGNASTGNAAYQGGLCGVTGFFEGGADGTTQAQWDLYTATTCGIPRGLRFWLSGAGGAATLIPTKSIARDLLSLSVGESRADQFEGFHVGQPNCTRAVFNSAYAGSDNPRRTRLPDAANGARQWRIESQGSHQAMCIYTAKGHDQSGGLTVPMPWAYTIGEVRY
jgi:hypothetical protein